MIPKTTRTALESEVDLGSSCQEIEASQLRQLKCAEARLTPTHDNQSIRTRQRPSAVHFLTREGIPYESNIQEQISVDQRRAHTTADDSGTAKSNRARSGSRRSSRPRGASGLYRGFGLRSEERPSCKYWRA